MDFYYGEPIEEIQEKYTIEHLWDEEWELRNLAPRGCLGLTKPAYITLRFKDKKLEVWMCMYQAINEIFPNS